MNRPRGHQLAPVYPGIVRAKKQRGVTDLEFATSVRQKFPIRANRLRGSFRPPEISRTYVLEVDSTDKTVLDKLLSDLKADPDVEFAEPDHLVLVRMTPNDPYFFSSGTWGQGRICRLFSRRGFDEHLSARFEPAARNINQLKTWR